jgi:hypothetical protein
MCSPVEAGHLGRNDSDDVTSLKKRIVLQIHHPISQESLQSLLNLGLFIAADQVHHRLKPLLKPEVSLGVVLENEVELLERGF